MGRLELRRRPREIHREQLRTWAFAEVSSRNIAEHALVPVIPECEHKLRARLLEAALHECDEVVSMRRRPRELFTLGLELLDPKFAALQRALGAGDARDEILDAHDALAYATAFSKKYA